MQLPDLISACCFEVYKGRGIGVAVRHKHMELKDAA